MAAGWNSSGGAVLLCEQRTVVGRVEPTDTLDRAIQISGKAAGVGTREGKIIPLSDQIPGHIETASESDRHLRTFIGRAAKLVCRAAHSECVGRNEYQIGREGLLNTRAKQFLSGERRGVDKAHGPELVGYCT